MSRTSLFKGKRVRHGFGQATENEHTLFDYDNDSENGIRKMTLSPVEIHEIASMDKMPIWQSALPALSTRCRCQ